MQRDQIDIDGQIYIRGDHVSEMFGWTRQNTSQVALREGWERIRDYHCYYLQSDVERYKLDRDHTFQAKEQRRWVHRGLIRHPTATCPICNNGKLDDNCGL